MRSYVTNPPIVNKLHFPPATPIRWKNGCWRSSGRGFFTILVCLLLFCPLPSASEQCIPTKEIGVKHNLKRHIVDEIQQVSLPLTLAVSDRVTQRMTTSIFKIFLEEVIGYQEIENVKIVDYLSPNKTLSYLIGGHGNLGEKNPPETMINLDLWLPPDFSDDQKSLYSDGGSQGTGARFGWYVSASSINFSNVIIDHWRAFYDERITQILSLSKSEKREVRRKYSISPKGDYYCPKSFNNRTLCHKGIFVPRQCKNRHCATLIAGDFRYSAFLPAQVTDLGFLVEIAWIGPNLTPEFLLRFRKHNRPLAFFSWWPNPLTVLDGFLRVSFPPSRVLETNQLWRYEFHAVRKKAWRNLDRIGLLALKSLERFILEEQDYRHLLLEYNRRTRLNATQSLKVDRPPGWDDDVIHTVACEWLSKIAKERPSLLRNTWLPRDYQMKPILQIAGIFPIHEDGGKYSSKSLLQAAFMAAYDINKNDSVLTEYELELSSPDGRCTTEWVMFNFIEYIFKKNSKPMIGILGPGCSDTVEPLVGVASQLNVMIVSYSAEGGIFSDQDKFPYFFRTIQENKLYQYVYLELFKQLGWTHIASIAEDNNDYSEYLTLLQNVLQAEGITIFNRKIIRGTKDVSTHLKDLKQKNNRIIIGDFYSDMACQIICTASTMGMVANQGFYWFLPLWLPHLWYDIDSKHLDIPCTTEQMLRALDGHLALGHAYFAPDDAYYHTGETVGQWRQRYEESFGNSTPGDYAGYTYDAMWTYAFALDKLLKESYTHMAHMQSRNTSRRFGELMRETNFTGISGHIDFGEGPSRRPTTVNIVQFSSKTASYHTVGQFFPNDAAGTNGVLELNKSAFHWFTADGQIPWDGSPRHLCLGLRTDQLGMSCEAINMILMFSVFGLILALVIGLAIFYRRKYERIHGINLLKDPIGEWIGLEEWEIPKENVVKNRKIGEGLFGTVYGGEVRKTPNSGWAACAIKTLKVGSGIESRLDFLGEAEMMKRFNHKNIVKLIGLSTRVEPIYMIMEFALYGNLKTYLLSRRHLVSEAAMYDDENVVGTRSLTSMALDIAMALEYLSSNKYVHRDVACRNCLVSADRVTKLSDFGLTRETYDTNYYRFNRKGWLPLRWTAPESLEDGIYTSMTDVWSYGVVLYEIITFGNFPYQNMSDLQVIDYVKTGGTIALPDSISDQLKRIVYMCWENDPNMRPSFTDMVDTFSTYNRLIKPCLETPLASVQTSDLDVLDNPVVARRVSVPKPKGNTNVNYSNHTLVGSPSTSSKVQGKALTTPVAKLKGVQVDKTCKCSVAEPLLPLTDSYIARYACLTLHKSPTNSVDRECHILSANK